MGVCMPVLSRKGIHHCLLVHVDVRGSWDPYMKIH